MIDAQFFTVIFGLFMIAVTLLRLQKQRRDVREYCLWLLVWLGVIIIALIPEIWFITMKLFSFSRRFDVLVLASLLFLSFVCIYTRFSLRQTQRTLQIHVRKKALEHPQKSHKSR